MQCNTNLKWLNERIKTTMLQLVFGIDLVTIVIRRPHLPAPFFTPTAVPTITHTSTTNTANAHAHLFAHFTSTSRITASSSWRLS
ncbi:hypothetical protein PILCRDRAFT_828545 [Piloderma croceum F 1598]|uniref:Uncharacterized protein n=1 Tax=Piloderma croceum (strain F 1598) TaxID=765440 RepID=A0A0C3ENI6_PILCF|nr:hypothetical protein PILCRDRAFT_828545 [Piloderma croceum F 1598]